MENATTAFLAVRPTAIDGEWRLVTNIKILVAGTEALVVEAFAEALRKTSAVLGTASDFVELRQKMQHVAVDLVIICATPNGWNEPFLIDWFSGLQPKVAMILVNAQNAEWSAAKVHPAGLIHVLPPDARLSDLFRALKMMAFRLGLPLAEGEETEQLSGRHPEPVDSGANQNIHLTQRQRQIISMIAMGESTKNTADKLGISVRTVEFHKYRVMKVLNLSSTPELIRFALYDLSSQ